MELGTLRDRTGKEDVRAGDLSIGSPGGFHTAVPTLCVS